MCLYIGIHPDHTPYMHYLHLKRLKQRIHQTMLDKFFINGIEKNHPYNEKLALVKSRSKINAMPIEVMTPKYIYRQQH